jgi:Na+-transporting NADH:ubiquinone oxidoreductase subunit F
VKITVNDRREIEAAGGQPLLAALRSAQVFLPSACGGRGACGRCRVKVEAGAGDFSPKELKKLSDEERAGQIRLACQVPVERDLRIRIPETLLTIREYKTEVVALRDLTYDIKGVRLKLLEPPELPFKAGQYVQVRVPGRPVFRSYSMASDPRQQSEIELQVRLVPGGICTSYIHRQLKVGDRLEFTGPEGDFALRDTGRDIIFIAGGSGMSPIKSMLHEMVNARSPRRAVYFFGAKALRDLFLVEEMRAFERALPNFSFVPALSAPEEGDHWSGERGLITEVVDRRYDRIANTEAYLCGSPPMIDACVAVLRKKGMTDDLIFYDKFA